MATQSFADHHRRRRDDKRGTAAVATARTWTIKGLSDRTRDAVYEATRAEGLTVGEWIDRALVEAAEKALHPSPPAATREEVAEVVGRHHKLTPHCLIDFVTG
jgi:hypothetical protein